MQHKRTAAQMHADNSATFKEEIDAEQVNQLYSLMPFGIIATFLNSLIIFFVLKDVMPQVILYAWFAAITVITMFRAALAIQFRRTEFQPATAPAWRRRFMAGQARPWRGPRQIDERATWPYVSTPITPARRIDGSSRHKFRIIGLPPLPSLPL